MVRQEVVITTRLVDNVSGAARTVTKTIQDMGAGVQRATTVTEGLTASGKRLSSTSVQVTRGLHRFQMELLSVMFFGFMLYRTFTGLVKTSMEWMGVTELLSMTLGILFLPLAEGFLEIVIWLSDEVSNLTDEQKSWISALTLGAIILSGFLFLVGQLGLGLAGLQGMGFFGTTSALSGIGTAASGASQKVGFLQTRLGKIARYAGATVLFGLAIKDGAEEQFQAAIGDIMMGIGLMKGGKVGFWIGVIGFVLKLTGDKDFLADIIALFLKVVDMLSRIGEEIGKMLLARMIPGKKYEPSMDFQEAVLKGVAEADVKSDLLRTVGLTIPEAEVGPGALGAPVTAANVQTFNFYNDISVTDDAKTKDMLEQSNLSLAYDFSRMAAGGT
jgi:hypothetical protein